MAYQNCLLISSILAKRSNQIQSDLSYESMKCQTALNNTKIIFLLQGKISSLVGNFSFCCLVSLLSYTVHLPVCVTGICSIEHSHLASLLKQAHLVNPPPLSQFYLVNVQTLFASQDCEVVLFVYCPLSIHV